MNPNSSGKLDFSKNNQIQIDPKYLCKSTDRSNIKIGFETARTLMHENSSRGLLEILPGPFFAYCFSSFFWNIYSCVYASSFFHACGTSKMASVVHKTNESENSVVDSQLRIQGMSGIRIADASIIPAISNAPIAATTAIIGWRLAEFLLAEKA
jgi:choline dehydrogenase